VRQTGEKKKNNTKARAKKLVGLAQFGKKTHAPQTETIVSAGTTMKPP
jgi:hypothetical protein